MLVLWFLERVFRVPLDRKITLVRLAMPPQPFLRLHILERAPSIRGEFHHAPVKANQRRADPSRILFLQLREPLSPSFELDDF